MTTEASHRKPCNFHLGLLTCLFLRFFLLELSYHYVTASNLVGRPWKSIYINSPFSAGLELQVLVPRPREFCKALFSCTLSLYLPLLELENIHRGKIALHARFTSLDISLYLGLGHVIFKSLH